MKGPLYISDDGKKQGTEQEVQDYERALSPLAKLNLPWVSPGSPANRLAGVRDQRTNIRLFSAEPWLVEFVNEGLPLIEEMRRYVTQNWTDDWRSPSRVLDTYSNQVRRLILAYEKALGIQP